MESDTMGAKRASDDEPTLTPDYASVQRFVILAADVLRVPILSTQPDEVEHVFACIEHAD